MLGKWWRARWSLWAAVGFLAVVAVAGALSLMGGNGRSSGHGARAAAVRTAENVSDSSCGMPAGDQRVPLASPKVDRWERIGAYVAPVAHGIGPGLVRGHVRECWAHSPTGAVYAAYSFFAVASAYNDTAAMRELTAVGRARDAALRAGSPASDPDTLMEPVGFRVTDYAPHDATVVVGYSVMSKPIAVDAGMTDPSLVALTYPMRWERGDWKLVVLPGDNSIQAERLDSIAGLVMFGAPR